MTLKSNWGSWVSPFLQTIKYKTTCLFGRPPKRNNIFESWVATYRHSISPWQYFVTWFCVESFRSRSPNTPLRTSVRIWIATKMCSCKPSNEKSQFRWSKSKRRPRFQINFLASFYIHRLGNLVLIAFGTARWRKKKNSSLEPSFKSSLESHRQPSFWIYAS